MNERRQEWMVNTNDITIKLIITRIRIHFKTILVNIVLVAIVMSIIMLSVPDYFRSDKIVGYEEKTSTIIEGLHEIGRLQGYNLGNVQLNPFVKSTPQSLAKLCSIRYNSKRCLTSFACPSYNDPIMDICAMDFFHAAVRRC